MVKISLKQMMSIVCYLEDHCTVFISSTLYKGVNVYMRASPPTLLPPDSVYLITGETFLAHQCVTRLDHPL